MNTDDLASPSVCYGLYDDNNKIIGFLSVLHQPHRDNKKIKRCSRLVILPDYQGIGLGTKFLSVIAKFYCNQGYDFSIRTSAKNLIYSLNKNDEWVFQSYDKKSCSTSESAIDYKRKSLRLNCKAASFFYKLNKEN